MAAYILLITLDTIHGSLPTGKHTCSCHLLRDEVGSLSQQKPYRGSRSTQSLHAETKLFTKTANYNPSTYYDSIYRLCHYITAELTGIQGHRARRPVSKTAESVGLAG